MSIPLSPPGLPGGPPETPTPPLVPRDSPARSRNAARAPTWGWAKGPTARGAALLVAVIAGTSIASTTTAAPAVLAMGGDTATPGLAARLVTGCPSSTSLNALAHGSWVGPAMRDTRDASIHCSYASTADPSGTRTRHEDRQILMTSTMAVPAATQFASFRSAKPLSTGGTVHAVNIAGQPALRYADPDGRLCQLMVATSEDSTTTILVNDPARAMANACALLDRWATALLVTR